MEDSGMCEAQLMLSLEDLMMLTITNHSLKL